MTVRFDMRRRRSDNAPSPERGFTLLELMVVCGVLAVLLGLGVGFLGKSDPYALAEATLQGELRAAQFTARGEGLPTEVLVEPSAEGAVAATVRSRLLEPIVTFAFEAQEAVLDESLRGEYGGRSVEQGRFGLGRRNAEDGRPLLRWSMTPGIVDLSEGFAVRLDVFLERRAACLLVRVGKVCDIRLDAGARPRARLRVTGGTTQASDTGKLESEIGLPLRQWCTLDFVCDGSECWLRLDGRELDRAPAKGRPMQEDADLFEVSPGGDAVPGIVDEVRLFAYAFGPVQALPTQIEPDRPYRIRFDERGEPLTSTVVEWVVPQEDTP